MALCDTFGARLYDYCHLHRGAPGPALDAVAATFAAASAHAERLHEAERLRAWLYAIARNISTRTPVEPSAPVMEDAPTIPPGEASRTSWAAMQAIEGLPPREREVLRLGLVHGLESHEIAAIMDMPIEQAAALAARIRGEFEDGVAAELVARYGRDACPALAGLTDETATAPVAPAALRRRVVRHIAGCPACGGTRLRLATPASPPAELLPVHVAPEGLYERAAAAAAGEAGQDGTAELEARAGRARGGRWRLGLAIAATLIILAAPLLMWTGGRDAGGMIGGPGIRQNGDGLFPVPGSPGASPTTTATPTGSPTPSATAFSRAPRPGESGTPPGSPDGPSPTRPTDPGSPTRDPGDSFEEERPADGTLAVSPSAIQLDAGESGTVQVSATGGDVSWSGTGATYLSPKNAGGVVRAGRSQPLTITLDANAPASGSSSYTVSDRGGGSATVTVTW